MDLEMRPIGDEEFEAWFRAGALGFGGHVREAEVSVQRQRFELDRSLAVFDDGEIVAGAHAFSFEMAVPGGSLPTAGVSHVSVQPTHRRRGILTALMERQLRDVHQRGEPLAALFSSESIIYGRFGYGIGSLFEDWSIDRQHTKFAPDYEQHGRISFVKPAEMRERMPEVYRRATVGRPGVVQRPGFSWDSVVLDRKENRRGASAYFHVAYEQDGRIDGYVTYRVKDDTLLVKELMAVSDEAHAALWRFCFDVDLMSSTKARKRPVDDPLWWMLADPRRLRRSLRDSMWLRLVDVPAALAGRSYARSGRLVVGVRDQFCSWNEGCFELKGGPEGAECRLSSEAPELELSAADLAAAYLGTVRFSTLAHAGRVQERVPGALQRADAMFATQLQPWSSFTF